MRWFVRILFALALFVLLWTPAAACSPAPFETSVTCPGEAPATVLNDQDVLAQISPACAAALGPEVRQLITDRQSRDKAYFTETRFSAAPWTAEGEDQLRAQERDLLACRYQRWQRSGDWLVAEDAARSYCGAPAHSGGACPTNQLSWVRFPLFALIHPTGQIWPYTLAAWLVVLGAGLWLARLLRRRQLVAFLRPGRLLGVVFIAALFIVLLMVATSWIDVVAWAIIIYLLACAARWSRVRSYTH